MSEKRTSAWLRETLCDEIESIRAGKSDHNRAKSVATLAAAVLKSVEVEMVFRQQQSEMEGTEHAELGTLTLCDQAALPAPGDLAEEPNLSGDPTDTKSVKSPIVPPGARFVPGRNASGSRGG